MTHCCCRPASTVSTSAVAAVLLRFNFPLKLPTAPNSGYELRCFCIRGRASTLRGEKSCGPSVELSAIAVTRIWTRFGRGGIMNTHQKLQFPVRASTRRSDSPRLPASVLASGCALVRCGLFVAISGSSSASAKRSAEFTAIRRQTYGCRGAHRHGRPREGDADGARLVYRGEIRRPEDRQW